MRCSASPTFDSAPSAVCASEMPSLALRMATSMPRAWAFMRSAMARPAASSLAELTRSPDESRCVLTSSDAWLIAVLRWAFSVAMLVLMMAGMSRSLTWGRNQTAPEMSDRWLVFVCPGGDLMAEIELAGFPCLFLRFARPGGGGGRGKDHHPARNGWWSRRSLCWWTQVVRFLDQFGLLRSRESLAGGFTGDQRSRPGVIEARTAPAAAGRWPARSSRCRPAAGSAPGSGWRSRWQSPRR
jgi:hypothetical protein